ncbi:MAG: Inositol 2-dehydrogenase/D-chiro-inositol 3-dehydrogenase [Planctomycetota bacterium]|jgi:predicted dehydrogenase
MKLRLGLIGLGKDWQTRHLPALRLLQDRFEVRAVYGSVAHLADQVARELRADRVDGYRALIEREDVDAVMMLESDWYGMLPLLAACDAGKAVYCSAEIDFEPNAAAEVKRRVEGAGIAFMSEFPRRFAPATLRLKELIATRLGHPRLLFCHRRLACESGDHSRSARSLNARSSRELIELIDWCRYIAGHDPNWVQAVWHPSIHDSITADYQVISIDFSSGEDYRKKSLAQISCGAYIPSYWHEAIAFRPPSAVQVCCEKGLAFVDLPSGLVWFDEAGRHQESLESELPVGQQLLAQFHRAVTSLVRKVGDLEDTYRALQTLESAQRSMREGIRIPLQFNR